MMEVDNISYHRSIFPGTLALFYTHHIKLNSVQPISVSREPLMQGSGAVR